jgi:hypothetical protein
MDFLLGQAASSLNKGFDPAPQRGKMLREPKSQRILEFVIDLV